MSHLFLKRHNYEAPVHTFCVAALTFVAGLSY